MSEHFLTLPNPSPLLKRRALFNGDLPSGLAFFAFDLGQFDAEDAVLHFGADGGFVHVVRQRVFLLEIGVSELAAEVVGVFVFLFVFEPVLDGDAEVVLFVHMNPTELFLDARRGELYDVGVFVLFDVDGRCDVVGGVEHVGVKEFV